MTRIIEFDHIGQLIRAVAIFNFAKDGCSVMVLPITGKDDFGDIVLIRKGQEWLTDSSIKSVFRLTYLKLVNEIDGITSRHVDAQKFLS